MISRAQISPICIESHQNTLDSHELSANQTIIHQAQIGTSKSNHRISVRKTPKRELRERRWPVIDHVALHGESQVKTKQGLESERSSIGVGVCVDEWVNVRSLQSALDIMKV